MLCRKPDTDDVLERPDSEEADDEDRYGVDCIVEDMVMSV